MIPEPGERLPLERCGVGGLALEDFPPQHIWIRAGLQRAIANCPGRRLETQDLGVHVLYKRGEGHVQHHEGVPICWRCERQSRYSVDAPPAGGMRD